MTLRAAFGAFSILPAGRNDAPGPDALAWLPLAGIVLGGAAGGAGWLASLWAPAPLALAVAFGAGIVLTGAIHLDGFLDCCDALFVPVDAARRRAILKDPHHGTFALAGLTVLAAGWLAALAAIPPAAYPALLAFAAGTARFAAVANAYAIPYAPGGASAQAFTRRPNVAIWLLGGAASLACAVRHPWSGGLLPVALVLALLGGRWIAGRLGGVLVGDAYGALITVLEAGLLAAAATLHL